MWKPLLLVVTVLLAVRLWVAVWRWRCPSCGRPRLRYVGLASEWSAEYAERRFPEAQCGGCGRAAVCRTGLWGHWEPL